MCNVMALVVEGMNIFFFAFVIWSQAGIIRATRAAAPHAWRRHLHLMLDAFRAERAHHLPEPPLIRTRFERTLIAVDCHQVECGEEE